MPSGAHAAIMKFAKLALLLAYCAHHVQHGERQHQRSLLQGTGMSRRWVGPCHRSAGLPEVDCFA